MFKKQEDFFNLLPHLFSTEMKNATPQTHFL